MKSVRKFILAALTLVSTIATIGYASWINVKNDIEQSATVDKTNKTATAYIIGKPQKYTSIEGALEAAVSGDIVTVFPALKAEYNDVSNKVAPDKVEYTISRNCTIKPGVTFLVPLGKPLLDTVNSSNLGSYIANLRTDDRTKESPESRGSNGTYGGKAYKNSNLYLRTTINIADNVTLTNSGDIVVSGFLSGGTQNGGMIGQTSHSYSRIVLGQNSKIIQTNANSNIHCYGYIEEKTENNGSMISINNGKLYVPFVVDDFKGIGTSLAMTGDDGAIIKYHCSPFNQFEFVNICPQLELSYNSKTYGYVNIYVSQTLVDTEVIKNFCELINLVGSDPGFVFQYNNSASSCSYKYTRSTDKIKVKFYNGLLMNNFSVTLKPTNIISIDLNTKTAYFPVSYKMDIELLNKGSNHGVFNFNNQMLKLLTGSKMHIGSGVVVQGSELISYTTFNDTGTANGKLSVHNISYTYPRKVGAELIIDDGADVTFNKIAGNIYCNPADIKKTSDVIIAYEPWLTKSNPNFKPTNIISEKRPYIIGDYLQIREKFTPLAFDLINKQKIYVGFNTYNNYASFIPAITIHYNDNASSIAADQYGTILFSDNISNYSVELVRNIYTVVYGGSVYKKNQIVTYDSNSSIVCGVNSTLNISNNNNGINEFNVQSIDVKCTTKLVDGKVPLYVGSTVQMEAIIHDIEKSYVKAYKWSSENPNIASIDQEGKLTGNALGQTLITCECDGIKGTYLAQVIESQEFIKISAVTIKNDAVYWKSLSGKWNKKNVSFSSDVIAGTSDAGRQYHGDYGDLAHQLRADFYLVITPSNAPVASILWRLEASQAGRQWINDSSVSVNTVKDVNNVSVYFGHGTNGSDDPVTLSCIVTGLDGTKFEIPFNINHRAWS